MSKQTGNRDKTADFLARKAPVDDFESEALKGFSTLSGDEKVLQLKEELDKKIYPVLFNGKQKQNKVGSWYAAAALLLLVGLIIYFFKMQNVIENKTVSQQVEKVEKKPEPTLLDLSQPASEKPQISDADADERVEAQKNTIKKGNIEPTLKPSEGIAKQIVLRENTISSKSKEQEVTATAMSVPYENKVNETQSETSDAVVEAATTPAAARGSANDFSESKPVVRSTNSVKDCLYEGGVSVFNSDLKKLLKEKSFNRAVKGVLYVNNQKQVQGIKIGEGKFTEDEKRQLELLLKQLNAFILPSNADKNMLYEYRFYYNP